MKTKLSVWPFFCLLFALNLISSTAFAQPCDGTNYVNYTGCEGDGFNVTIEGTIYDESNTTGVESIFGGSYNGCDSVIFIELNFVTSLVGEVEYTGCIGDGYTVIVNGNTYTEANPNGVETLASSAGCDSIVVINLIFENSVILEITSTSLASCPDNSSTSACNKTCSNSTISYTVPNSQSLDLEWEVLGAESYVVDDNMVTVTWGNPGTGAPPTVTAAPCGPLQLNGIQRKKGPDGQGYVTLLL